MKKSLPFLAIFFTTSSFAWGPTGHRVVGEVAQKYLSLNTYVKVKEILKGESLAKIANWPDEIRSEPQTYSHTYVWHYTEWKDETDDHPETESTGMLLTSIQQHIDVLKKVDSKPEDKLFSLKFIVHLVGDLHQPFHVGNGLDRGGNFCKINYFKQETNLHKIWDEDMIDSSKLSFSELTDFVLQGMTAEKMKQIKSGDANDWAKESREIRAIAYPLEVTPPTPPVTPLNLTPGVRSYCTQTPPDPTLIPKISYDYNYKFMSTLHKRLLEGGIRLAMVLNQIYDNGNMGPFKKSDKKINHEQVF